MPMERGGGVGFGIKEGATTGGIQTTKRGEGHNGGVLTRAENVAC